MDENLPSYGGLCCRDCIPSRSASFMLADNLDTQLTDIPSGHYAELTSAATEEFKQ